jgi:hypothetical protein
LIRSFDDPDLHTAMFVDHSDVARPQPAIFGERTRIRTAVV